MSNDKSKKRPAAGQAFREAAENDADSLAAGQRLKLLGAIVRAIGAKVGPAMAVAKAEGDAKLRGLEQEARRESAKLDAEWERTYGASFPKTVEDWQRLARRAGLPADYVVRGQWSPDEVAAAIEGYLLWVMDLKNANSYDNSDRNGANSASAPNLFSGDMPSNQDVVDLVVRLDAAKGSGTSDIAVARKFTRETVAYCPKAKSLLAIIRRLKRNGRVTL